MSYPSSKNTEPKISLARASTMENDFSSFHEPSKWYYVLALYSGLPATKSELIKAIELVKDNPEYQKKLKKIQEDI